MNTKQRSTVFNELQSSNTFAQQLPTHRPRLNLEKFATGTVSSIVSVWRFESFKLKSIPKLIHEILENDFLMNDFLINSSRDFTKDSSSLEVLETPLLTTQIECVQIFPFIKSQFSGLWSGNRSRCSTVFVRNFRKLYSQALKLRVLYARINSD